MELTKNCTGCMACYNKCPNNAISVVYNEGGFYTPHIDKEKCTNCGLCNSVCPQIHESINQNMPDFCYGVMADDDIRQNSASGGVFAVIAQEYLKNGGYVCGAAFSDDFKRIEHIIINNEKDLIRLQNSKYVQSYTGKVFSGIKKLLDENKEVLFSGTPCQVAGLNSYLGKDYDNLLTMDLICHGIPSPLVWEKYLNALAKGRTVNNLTFRNKKYGWIYKGDVEIELKNKLFASTVKDNLFYRSFFELLILNEACFNCKYLNLNRPADLTIGDFWGIEYKDPEMDDQKGTSLLIIHTPKGQRIVNKFKNKFKKFREYSINTILTGNSNLRVQHEKKLNNTKFIRDLRTKPILKNLKDNLCPDYEGIIKNQWQQIDNFGATLSAYAVQQYFQQRGKDYYLIKEKPSSYYTNAFAKKYLKTTVMISTPEQYKELNEHTNNFVLGTDQVLRALVVEYILNESFFGYSSFNKKRITFSGSFGVNKLEKMHLLNRIKYNKLIKRFDNISTRELSGVDICKKEFNIKADYIIDPVFLIDKNKWLEIAPDTKNKYKNKIVCYLIWQDDEQIEKIKEYLQNKYKKEVVLLVNGKLPIEEFLSAVKDADYVVTNSFHGTCFAMIFNKKFVSLSKNNACDEARFDSLMKIFGINSCVIKDFDELCKREELFAEYDYNKFNTVLKQEQARAEIWFDMAVNKKKQITTGKIFAEIDFKIFTLIERCLMFFINKYIYLKFLYLCNKKNKLVVWGASIYFQELLKKHPEIADNILGIVDKNPSFHYKKISGCMVYPPEKLAELKPKIVVSMVKNRHENVHKSIREYLKKNYPEVELWRDIFGNSI